jgi:hypothetical protein
MERSFNFKTTSKISQQEVSKKIAIHEAGHATAIYIGNQQKGLPPVFFQIFVKPLPGELHSIEVIDASSEQYIAKVEGGRLIHTLPSSFSEATKGFSHTQRLAYQRAFEADIVNLLVGPLAEAQYVALRDDELINPLLVNVNALHNYGGSSDLDIVNEYLDCFFDSEELKNQKMDELFLEAFQFVSNPKNWRIITSLAETILSADTHIIECNEIVSVAAGNNLILNA